jgi:anti-sigma factor RsiW
MDETYPRGIDSTQSSPITEADLHAYVDRQLTPERMTQIEAYLSTRPNERERVNDWQRQNALLHELLDPVVREPVPLRLPLRPIAAPSSWRGLAAGVLIAVVSAGSAWSLRGVVDGEANRLAFASPSFQDAKGTDRLTGFAHRAAVAHVVYSPDIRRPVEVNANEEQALVTWLTKRMGTAVKPPSLAGLGYELIGGRLLPGDTGPVAQFMYGAADGQRLTLYVTREVVGANNTAFNFGRDGPVNVFYWVEGHFGYAISAGADRGELLKVSKEVYRQLAPS